MEKLIKLLAVLNGELDKIDMCDVSKYDLGHDTSYFKLDSGREHYRILSYASSLFNNETIFDIGTNKCMSAIALSYNPTNNVRTYDIVKMVSEYPTIDNIKFFMTDSTKDELLINSPLIFLDVDHDGLYENIFYNHLKAINWKGLLLLDDIHLNEPMILFWNSITEDKYDLTQKGHWSGTGLVHFK